MKHFILILVLLLAVSANAEQQCVGGTCREIGGQEHCSPVYCFDCETNTQEYWCSKQVPQPHTCCESGWQIRDSDKGDIFPSVLQDCNVYYSYCVEEVAKLQEQYNGCSAVKGLPLVQSLDVIERKHFSDVFECQAHDAACAYTRFAWQAKTWGCMSQ